MDDKLIRKEVRKVLHEKMQQFHPAFAVNGGSNMFPYNKVDDIVRLPEDIKTKEDYLVDWDEAADNQDLYGFPLKEFMKGIYVEKTKKKLFNVLDVAEIVINKLKENRQFYSNLGV